MQKVKNRWLIAASAVGVHISIGAVYAWSVFQNPMADEYGWSTTQISFAFSLAIFFLGFSAAFLGKFVEKHGPRRSGLVAAIFYTVGIIGTGLAVYVESLMLLYLFYGVIGGIGLGVGYITPVSTLVKWFPDRRGLATGMAIMGFGFGATITSPIAEALVRNVGIPSTFVILGAAYFIVMTLSSLYLQPPPKDWLPEDYVPPKESNKSTGKITKDLTQLTAVQAVKTGRFWMLWFMLFLNVTCGIAILAVAAKMGEEITGMSSVAAASMVGIMGFFNGGGRIVWATVSDYIGRPNVYTTFFVLSIFAYAILPFATSVILFQILLFAVMSTYGGGFSSIPAYLSDVFGTKEVGAIHGYILTAWAMAGMAGPLLLSAIYDTSESYTLTMYIFVVLFAIAFILSLWIRKDIKRLSEEEATPTNDAKVAP